MQKYLVAETVINTQGRSGIYTRMAREVRVQRANDQDKEKRCNQPNAITDRFTARLAA